MVGGEKSRRKTKTVSNRFPLTPNVVAFTVQIQQLHNSIAPHQRQSERLFAPPVAIYLRKIKQDTQKPPAQCTDGSHKVVAFFVIDSQELANYFFAAP